ncbi:MAG: indole-3-glycerol phosphate synthase TrpC [Myxococcota bacterium]
MGWLEVIVAHKWREIAWAKEHVPAAWLAQQAEAAPAPRPFAHALRAVTTPRIIAEVKRASPSRGVLRQDATTLTWDGVQLARDYAAGGAAALSVLTDIRFFWGAPDLVARCHAATDLPVLRKEFVLDPYQVDESRWLGADAVLLIARLLDRATLAVCAARARELGMDALVEVHDATELEVALAVEGALVGVNHRDLDTGAIDRDLALRLRPRVPDDRVMVAESGLRNAADLSRLWRAGIGAFLIGETLAASAEPQRVLAELLDVR